MVDNIGITPGSGASIAAQDRSGQLFQQVLDTGAETINVQRVSVTTTATQIVAARANRKSVIIQSLITNTDNLDLGIVGIAQPAGFPLLPGDSIEIPTTAAVYGDAYTGTQVVAFIECYD